MKHLLTGVALAAALAITAPVWAQTSTAPMTPPASGPAAAPAKPPVAKSMPVHPRPWMHHVVHDRASMNMAEQLNAQELQRITSGAPPTAAPAMPPGGNYK
jgi:hypothetical protein